MAMRRATRTRRLSALRGAANNVDSSAADVASAASSLAPGTASSSNNNANSSSGTTPSGSNGVFTLMVHGPEFNNGEYVVLNPECFPGVKPLDLVELKQQERAHPRLIVQVASLAPVRGKLQVSLLKELAAQFGLEAFQPVAVTAVDARGATAEYMELTFKDQYLSSADIWRVKVALFGKCVYVGKTVECLGIRSQVEGLLAGGAQAFSGVIGDATKIIVRSRSSRLFWLVQMSAEMWEFAPDGELYYEKLVDQLLREIIARWTASSVSHSVTIIAFSRSFYDADQFPAGFSPTEPPFLLPSRQCYSPEGLGVEEPTGAKRYAPTIHVDPHSGRYYEDFYKVVVLSYTGPDWGQLRVALKKEFATYHETHRWRGPDEFIPAAYEFCAAEDANEAVIPGNFCARRSPETIDEADTLVDDDGDDVDDDEDQEEDAKADDGRGAGVQRGSPEEIVKWTRLPFGVPSRAADGNILEAINVTLNILDKHHMDRDLNRTGQSIVMITAGCSIFNVREQLAEVTQQRMMDNGVGMDMISLAAPPLHVVPLFIYHDPARSAVPTDDGDDQPTCSRKLSFARADHDGELSEVGAHSANGIGSADAKVRYQVPHWVNITFLDFDCKCSCNNNQQSQLSHHPDRKEGSRLLSHRAHSCQCQFRKSKQFVPLPPFRMFDASAPNGKVSPLPAALRNIIHGYPRSANAAKEKGRSLAQTLEEELKTMQTTAPSHRNALPHAASLNGPELQRQREVPPRDSVSVFLPDEWQISRSPDYALSVSPMIKRATTNLNLSLITREALLEYDAEVFAPSVGSHTSLSMDFRGVSGAPGPGSPTLPSLEEAPNDIMSATFDGDMSSMLKANQRRVLNRGAKLASSGASSGRMGLEAESGRACSSHHSTIGSILSPRDDKRVLASASTPLLPERSTSSSSDRPAESSAARGTHARARPVTISQPRPSAGATASDPAQRHRNAGTSRSPRSSPTTVPPQDLLGKSFDSSQRLRSRLRVERRQGSSTAAMTERQFLISRSESYHLADSPAASASSSHRSDQHGFRPLERAATMTRVLDSASAFTPVSSPPFAPSTRASQQLRMFSPSKFTYTGMRRGQSEFFLASTPSTAAQGGVPHARGIAPSNNGVHEMPGIESRKPSVNPFRYSAEAFDTTSQSLSIDRRRWSHLFPVLYHFQELKANGEVLNNSASSKRLLYIGPNWKSLVTPAILPLTTDYFPSPKELRDSYTESFYTLTLPFTSRFDSVPKYNNHDELLIEMICQRLACDFQLVTSSENASDADAGGRGRQAPSGGSTTGQTGGGGRYSTRRLDQAPDSHTVVYHLSTGHRIHQLIYDPERQTIEVKQYFLRSAAPRELAASRAPTSPPPSEIVPYRYSLWVDATQSFHPLQQEFHRFPTHNENWNSTDHLLCGYHDHMSDRSKCRRIRFAVVPPTFPVDQSRRAEAKALAAAHAAKFARFLDYLQSRVAPNDDGTLETISVAVELDVVGVRHRPAVVLPKGFNSRCYKVCCRTSSASISPSSSSSSLSAVAASGGSTLPHPPTSSGSKTRSEDTRTEWVMLNLEDTMDVTRTYHLDVRWLACSGSVADDFVSALKRKAKHAGLELRRIPEYSSVAFLQIHPLIAPVLLPLPPSVGRAALGDAMGVGKRKSRLVRIVEVLGFVLDDERIADCNGIGFGLGIEREEATAAVGHNIGGVSAAGAVTPAVRFPRRSASLTTRMLLAKFRTRGYQQFMHRQLPVFVRVTHTGVVWVPSYEYEEKLDSARTAEVFRALSEALNEL